MIERMDHVGIVVDDLAAATEFFVELGLELQGEGPVEGRWVDHVVGLDGVRAEIAVVQTPDGHGRLELTKFHTPSSQDDNRHAPANTPGIRHVAFAVEDIDAVVADLRPTRAIRLAFRTRILLREVGVAPRSGRMVTRTGRRRR
jgi:catechol 2,3-dioxygenase-like lactoylglutathione lyase family enzyme